MCRTFYRRDKKNLKQYLLSEGAGSFLCQSTRGGLSMFLGSGLCCCFSLTQFTTGLKYFEGGITTFISAGTEIWTLTIFQKYVCASYPSHQLSELLHVSPYCTTQLQDLGDYCVESLSFLVLPPTALCTSGDILQSFLHLFSSLESRWT